MVTTFQTTFSNAWIWIKISLKFVPKGPIKNIPASGQIMAWRHSGDTPSSEPMMVSLLTHICVTRPQWVNWNIPVEYKRNCRTKLTDQIFYSNSKFSLDQKERQCETHYFDMVSNEFQRTENDLEPEADTEFSIFAWLVAMFTGTATWCWPVPSPWRRL